MFPSLNLDASRSLFDIRYWGQLTRQRSYMDAAVLMRAFVGVLNIAKIASKYIGKSLTVTGGTSSYRPQPGWSAIVAVVGALPSLVRALSLDLAPLRVNVITPGLVKTELMEVRVYEQ